MSNDSTSNSGYRWGNVTPDDRSGILYITAFLSFTYSSITFITRCFIKWRVLGLDDAAALAAEIASLVQFSLLLTSLSAGLSKNFALLKDDEYARMASSQYGNQIALYIALGLSKLATILLVQRLFTPDMRAAWLICKVVTGMALGWTILAALLVSVGCSPESLAPQAPSQTCPSIVTRYRFVIVTDAVTDVILVAVPTALCWRLHMDVRNKLQVFAVFGFRLPLVALVGLFLKTWERSLESDNPGVHRTPAIIYQQVELCGSLIAATIPCVKGFIQSFDTGSGVKAGIGSSNDYSNGRTGSRPRREAERYQLSSFTRSKDDASRSTSRTRLKDDDGTIRANVRPFTASRSVTALRRKKSCRDAVGGEDEQDIDRHSQGSRTELFATRDE
ncbi:hypothetical protein FB567DRAFT_445343 [Paraphoma chrysanthemicola]|uniref:Rhodopsin domain-containing protein n=1 Tax=Paraphoma chrysanthemicola TaxID=798071 RepID=A0A8K0VWQ5_9PLEO|nr:hypothetical protein FB567DRAFT_445343 [Paraphoma chrysanthemicola]